MFNFFCITEHKKKNEKSETRQNSIFSFEVQLINSCDPLAAAKMVCGLVRRHPPPLLLLPSLSPSLLPGYYGIDY